MMARRNPFQNPIPYPAPGISNHPGACAIRDMYADLSNSMRTVEITAYLFQYRIFTAVDKDIVESQATHHQKNTKLLDTLMRSGNPNNAVEAFQLALRKTDHDNLADELAARILAIKQSRFRQQPPVDEDGASGAADNHNQQPYLHGAASHHPMQETQYTSGVEDIYNPPYNDGCDQRDGTFQQNNLSLPPRAPIPATGEASLGPHMAYDQRGPSNQVCDAQWSIPSDASALCGRSVSLPATKASDRVSSDDNRDDDEDENYCCPCARHIRPSRAPVKRVRSKPEERAPPACKCLCHDNITLLYRREYAHRVNKKVPDRRETKQYTTHLQKNEGESFGLFFRSGNDKARFLGDCDFYISKITAGSAADGSGLMLGDTVMFVNRENVQYGPIKEEKELRLKFAGRKVVELTVARANPPYDIDE